MIKGVIIFMEIITARSIKKVYQTNSLEVKAIDCVNLQVEKGEFVAITGSSGSGKTTLLNILGGLVQPTNGAVYVGGYDISGMDAEELTKFRRKHIGFVFQDYNLIPVMNVYENICFPLELENKEINEDFYNEVISMLGIEEKIYQMPDHLSGGQQQRVAIARALISEPDVVLADEPTGNLDSRTSEFVIDLLEEMVKKLKQTLVIVTHDEKVARRADRVIEMADGNIRI